MDKLNPYRSEIVRVPNRLKYCSYLIQLLFWILHFSCVPTISTITDQECLFMLTFATRIDWLRKYITDTNYFSQKCTCNWFNVKCCFCSSISIEGFEIHRVLNYFFPKMKLYPISICSKSKAKMQPTFVLNISLHFNTHKHVCLINVLILLNVLNRIQHSSITESLFLNFEMQAITKFGEFSFQFNWGCKEKCLVKLKRIPFN